MEVIWEVGAVELISWRLKVEVKQRHISRIKLRELKEFHGGSKVIGFIIIGRE